MSFGSSRPVGNWQGQAGRTGGSNANLGHDPSWVRHPGVERLARLGFAAKGFVYLMIGFLALRAALGPGGKVTDPAGALRELFHQPFGQFMLGAVAVGIFGYALWRLVQAVFQPQREDSRSKEWVHRLGAGFSGITYAALGLSAIRLLAGGRETGDSFNEWTSRLMAQPLGQWLVGLAGVAAAGAGLYFLAQGFSAGFRKTLRLQEMSAAEERWATLAGRVGYSARGIVFGMIGFFLIQAALHANAGEARGIGQVLNALAKRDHGPWMLGLVAAGLMAYGVYMFVEARYRRVWG